MGQVHCCQGSRDDPEPGQQCLLLPASPEVREHQRVRVTQGRRTKKRDLLLLRDSLLISKAKRDSAPRPELCLALAVLQVFCSGKGAAGDGAEEEETKETKSLVFVWPWGSCIVTFCSRVVKELWLSALLGPPEGVEGARVTRLPSIKLLMKELRRRNAAKPLDARGLEKLVKRQAEAGPKQQPPPVPSGSQSGLGHREGGIRWRMSLPWPFSRRGTSAAAEVPRPSGSGSSGALFGRPLAEVCSQDGTLPQPIQDLLALLQEHGPSSEGIFRLAAGERASRELREALDSGAEVDLESQPPHLLAVVLKDFLRKIPSKLLRSELFEQWMGALQVTSRQEKVVALKEVASQLPKANFLLLKELLFVLHKISRSVATSRMTAQNLAICVGPNLLSPPEEHTLPLEALAQVTQKVTQLVEFLVENQGELFEEEEVADLARASDEELPAPQVDAETAEVPSVAPEGKHQSSSQEKRLPGSSHEIRKRRTTDEDGQPERKRRKIESSQGQATEAFEAGKKNEETRCRYDFAPWISSMSSDTWALKSCIVQPQHHLGRGSSFLSLP